MTRPRSGKGERGSALVEMVWLGILLLVPLLWIVITVFEVQRGAYAVSSAARAAGRAFVLAPDDATGRAAAQETARLALTDQGIADPSFTLSVRCTPYPADCHRGTSVVTVRIDSGVDLPLLPEVLGGDAPSFALDASHTVPVGQYQETGP